MLENKISVIRKGAQIIEEVAFESLREGDTVFAGGGTCVVGEDAHYSVELIDKHRVAGWIYVNPKLKFIFNEHNPTIVGIDAIDK